MNPESSMFKSESSVPNVELAIPLAKSQTDLLANVLSRIFWDQLPFTYLIPDEAERRAVLPRLLSSVIRATQLHGETYTTRTVDSASLWISPGHSLTTDPLTIGRASFERHMMLRARTEEVRRHLARKPHWYLVALGVESSRQKASIGKALLEPVLSRADSEWIACYLETFREEDLTFFETHGFRIEGSGRIPDGGPSFWTMMRTPQRQYPAF